MNTDKVSADEVLMLLKQVFQKILEGQLLSTREVEELMYFTRCKDDSLFRIICVIHSTLDQGNQNDVVSLAKTMEKWAASRNIDA